MAHRTPLWQQNGVYSANYDRGFITAVWPQGGATGAKATVVANTMNVSLPPGTCVVPLTDGTCELCVWDAAELVAIPQAPPSGQIRYDEIVCTVRDSAVDAGANNDFIFQVISGAAAASSPPRPVIPPNSYRVFEVAVPGAVANLNGVGVGDVRSPLLPGPTIHGRVYRQAAFTFAAGAGGALVQMDTVATDPFGMWYQSWGGMILPCSGLWLMRARVNSNPTGTAEAMIGRMRVNQTEVMQDQRHASSNWGLSVSMDHVGRQTAGDLIDVTMQNSVGSRNGQAGPDLTFLACTYLGP